MFVSTANNNPSGYVAIARRYFNNVPNFNQPMTPNISGSPIMLPSTNRYRQVLDPRLAATAGHSLYTARAFPQEYWNRIAFVNEPTGGLTAQFILQHDGADVTSYNPSNLLASSDEWMSPIFAEVGPDGAIWVIDFYSFIIQHNPTPRRLPPPKAEQCVRNGASVTMNTDASTGWSGKTLRRTNRVT